MSKILIIIILVSSWILQSCGILIPQKKSWDFIQSVGGIKIDSISRHQNKYLLYTNVNVSGLDSITVKPQHLNSALSCSKIYIKVNESKAEIYIVVGVGLSGIGYSYCKCRPEKIKYLKHKTYNVYYKDIDGKKYYIQKIELK